MTRELSACGTQGRDPDFPGKRTGLNWQGRRGILIFRNGWRYRDGKVYPFRALRRH